MEIKETKDIQEIEDMILSCYKTDSELLEKYHVLAPNSLVNCVSDTVMCFRVSLNEYNLVIYKIYDNDVFCGYFGINEHLGLKELCGFFIIPEYRTDGFKGVWLRYLMSKFDNHILCGLYSKNIRGIKFLLNMGFENLKLNFNLEGVEAQLFGLKKS